MLIIISKVPALKCKKISQIHNFSLLEKIDLYYALSIYIIDWVCADIKTVLFGRDGAEARRVGSDGVGQHNPENGSGLTSSPHTAPMDVHLRGERSSAPRLFPLSFHKARGT
ncbi:hypothetical protein Ddc_10394 [Ditylenchus destructor]|nr:hypothetical protein Ddc_10394 [Ditylenchus destructor]